MISYELVKELKDAGFPGMNKMFGAGNWVFEHVEKTPEGDLITYGDALPCPSLEELIEACGEELRYMQRKSFVDGEQWVVNGLEGQEEISAGTLVVAVARLWLALNNKI